MKTQGGNPWRLSGLRVVLLGTAQHHADNDLVLTVDDCIAMLQAMGHTYKPPSTCKVCGDTTHGHHRDCPHYGAWR